MDSARELSPTYSERYLSTLHSFETELNAVEGHLTRFAVKPIVGIATALAKMSIGAIQTVSAVALSTIFLIGAIFATDRRGALRCAASSASHILKGIKNIGVGFLEAIPVLGTQVASYQIKQIPGTLKVTATSLPKDFGNGLMLKNPVLQSTHHIADKMQMRESASCTASYSIGISSHAHDKTVPMTFPNAALMQKAIMEELFAKLQACGPFTEAQAKETVNNSNNIRENYEHRAKFIHALCTELFAQYAALTKDASTVVILPNSQVAPIDGYVYELAGTMKRKTFVENEAVRVKFDLGVTVAFFNRL